jgi:chromosome segregation ATPase
MKRESNTLKNHDFSRSFGDYLPEGRAHTQRELTAARSEIAQLRATIVGLRDELEKAGIGESERRQKAVREANEEIRQLKDTVQALREELEKTRALDEDRRHRSLAELTSQVAELKATIVAMRTMAK